MLATLLLVRVRKNWESLPTWMWFLLEVAGIQILTSLKLLMVSFMRVVRLMIKAQPWLVTTV